MAYQILRPLPYTILMPQGPCDNPQTHTTVQSLLIQLCVIDVEVLEQHARTWGLLEYSPTILAGMWSATSTLISILANLGRCHRDQAGVGQCTRLATDLFTRTCALARVIARDLAAARIMMQGILALVSTTGCVIPPEAAEYFEGIDIDKHQETGAEGLRGFTPLGLELAKSRQLVDQCRGSASESEANRAQRRGTGASMRRDLAELSSKWNRFTVD